MQDFLSILQSKIRPDFLPIIEEIKTGGKLAILATSAASIYAKPFGEMLGFPATLASEINGEENRCEEKKRKVLEYIAAHNLQNHKKIVYTDHIEDKPLMEIADEVVWFGNK